MRAVLLASAITAALLFGVMDDVWAPGDLHLAGQRHHDPLDRGAHRVRRADLARPVGVRRHRRADRRPASCTPGSPIELAILARDPAHDPGRSRLRRPGPAHPRGEPRRRHPRPRVPRVRGRLRQPVLPRRLPRRRHPHRPREALRHRGRRLQPPARLGGGEPRVLRAARPARGQPPPVAHRPPAHRGAHQRASRRVARHLRVRREALRLRGVGGARGGRRHPGGLPGPGDHLHRVQRVRLDQQPRPCR